MPSVLHGDQGVQGRATGNVPRLVEGTMERTRHLGTTTVGMIGMLFLQVDASVPITNTGEKLVRRSLHYDSPLLVVQNYLFFASESTSCLLRR